MSAEQAVAQGAAHAPTAAEYINHHLQHLQYNFALQPVKQTRIVDFSLFNADSLFYSVVLGALACFVMWLAARKATAGVPGRFQAMVEILVEFVDTQARSVIHNKESLKAVSPIALTIFVWIFLLNAMDMLPVDGLPALWAWMYGNAGHDPAHAYMRVVPTADLSAALGISSSVLLMTLYYGIKVKGVGGFAHELVTAPFGSRIFMAPINFVMQLIEYASKTISHGMRLFGNMFAGELVFMLIAMLGAAWSWGNPILSSGLGIAHILAGSVWAIFHILVITLQAFIFMMLFLIYVGQAHSSH
ncbi:MAG: F0F1 ATP synthase subunit A [Brachymonas sp.]